MRLCIIVRVPGTDHLRYEADRPSSYVDALGTTVDTTNLPFSEEERAAHVVAASANWPLVGAIMDLKNAFIPPEAPQSQRAFIEVFPLYDAGAAIVDTLNNMEDAALEVVPVEAIQAAPGLTTQERQKAYQRLAQLALNKLPTPVRDAVSLVAAGG